MSASPSKNLGLRMLYNFDEIVERRGTSCVKWDESPFSDVIPLWVADMDFKAAPAILDAVRQRAGHGVFGYTVVGNDYYQAIVSWFKRRHQWAIRREEILYTTGERMSTFSPGIVSALIATDIAGTTPVV